MAVELAERTWISRYSIEPVGLYIHLLGVLADPDGSIVSVDMTNEVGEVNVFSGHPSTRTDVGTYVLTLQSADTADPGYYRLDWRFHVATVSENESTFIEVGQVTPAFDGLAPEFKQVVENVRWRFADLYDSPMGGPHLQAYFQTKMDRGRMAQIMTAALGRLNMVSQPFQTYTVGPTGTIFPLADWGGLLELATYIECVKHLIRSYTEQPLPENISTARLDRRDYMNRWQEVLSMEQEDYKNMLDVFKIMHMGLSTSPRVLVSGGVYGSYGPTRLPGSAAMPRNWARFY